MPVFVRTDDGLLLLLNSPKWRLERGKTYSVSLIAGSRSVDAEALAETRGVTIALADRPFKEAMRTASVLEVRGEGATLRVPLDGSSEAFRRLESCLQITVVKRAIPTHSLRQVAPRRRKRDMTSERREMVW